MLFFDEVGDVSRLSSESEAAGMKIHALQTGSVQVKEAFRRGVGSRGHRALNMLRSREWSEPLPIHCWAIEHADGVLLVDCGETAAVRDTSFARFAVAPSEELVPALAAVGIAPGDVACVVLTHLHGDHMNGLAQLGRRRVLVHERELRAAASLEGRLGRRLAHSPLPPAFAPEPLTLREEPFGAFSRSAPITADGAIVAVATPGHTPGHMSVILAGEAVGGDLHHYLLAGDTTYDEAQLLDDQIDGVAPSATIYRDTLARIRAHADAHPTIYLPSHDPASADRLRDRTTLPTRSARPPVGTMGASR
jgi:N-acyl homoserine lactone hydrolase